VFCTLDFLPFCVGRNVTCYVKLIVSSFSLGGNGYINEYPAGRLLRDAKLYEIGAGTSEVRRLVIARAINAQYKS
jgi:isovaleryl-CoA dehydrogenase